MLLRMNLANQHYRPTLWLGVVLFFKLLHATPAEEEGDPCRIKSFTGTCTTGSKCDNLESKMSALGLTGKDIVSCGFTAWEELICCPDRISTTTINPPVIGNPQLDENSEYFDFSKLIRDKNATNIPNITSSTTSNSGKNELNERARAAHFDPINARQPGKQQPRVVFTFPGGIVITTTAANVDAFRAPLDAQRQPISKSAEIDDETTQDPKQQGTNNKSVLEFPRPNFGNMTQPLIADEDIINWRIEEIFDKNFERPSAITKNPSSTQDLSELQVKQIFSNNFPHKDPIARSSEEQRTNNEPFNFGFPSANFGNVPQSKIVDEDLRNRRIEEIFSKNFEPPTESQSTNSNRFTFSSAITKNPSSTQDLREQRMNQIFSNNFPHKDPIARSSQQQMTTKERFNIDFPSANFGNVPQPKIVDEDLGNRRMEEIFDKNFVPPTESQSTTLNRFVFPSAITKNPSSTQDLGEQKMNQILSSNIPHKDTIARGSQQQKTNNERFNFDFPSANFGNVPQPKIVDEDLGNRRMEEIFDKNFVPPTESQSTTLNSFVFPSAITMNPSSTQDLGEQKMNQILSSNIPHKDTIAFGNVPQPKIVDEDLRNRRLEQIFDKNWGNNPFSDLEVVEHSTLQPNNEFFIKSHKDHLTGKNLSLPQFRMNPAQTHTDNFSTDPRNIEEERLREFVHRILKRSADGLMPKIEAQKDISNQEPSANLVQESIPRKEAGRVVLEQKLETIESTEETKYETAEEVFARLLGLERSKISNGQMQITITGPRSGRPAARACLEIDSGLQPNLTPHILGGTPVELGEYPHVVAIGYNDSLSSTNTFDCGGTLIDKRFVLTAAHCLVLRNRRPTVVRMGVVNFTDPDQMKNMLELSITKIHVHPQYVNSKTYNDIGLLELEKEVDYERYPNVYPTCLYTDLADPPEKSVLYVTGWGVVDTRTRAKSEHLLKARQSIVSLEVCNASYVTHGLTRQINEGIRNTQMCTRDPAETPAKDACQGDSGGPLNLVVDESMNKYRIVGVISAGFSCASSTPGLHTRVAAYLDWIESVVWPTR